MPMSGQLTFPYEFPKPGRYRIWVQAKPNRRVLTAHLRRGRSLSSLRIRLFVAMAVIAAAGCVRLGFWQLHRRQERRARNALITSRLDSAAVDPRSLPRDTAAARFRRVRVSGTPDYAHELIYAVRTRAGIAGRQPADASAAREHRHGGSGESGLGVLAGREHDRHRAMARSRFDVHRLRRGASVDGGGDLHEQADDHRAAIVWCRVEGASVSGAALLRHRARCGRHDQRGHAHRTIDDSRSRRGPAPELRHSMVRVCGGRPHRSRVRDQAVALRRRPWCSPCPPHPVSTGGASGRG